VDLITQRHQPLLSCIRVANHDRHAGPCRATVLLLLLAHRLLNAPALHQQQWPARKSHM
jgi:hypothetical protein